MSSIKPRTPFYNNTDVKYKNKVSKFLNRNQFRFLLHEMWNVKYKCTRDNFSFIHFVLCILGCRSILRMMLFLISIKIWWVIPTKLPIVAKLFNRVILLWEYKQDVVTVSLGKRVWTLSRSFISVLLPTLNVSLKSY